MLNSVMLDLETMGSGNNAAIVSIGAFKFDMNTPQPPEQIEDVQKFYCNVDLKTSMAAGLKVDGDTIMWWLDREEVAQAKLKAHPLLSLHGALNDFTTFFGPNKFFLWGNGATFDNVILRSAFDAIGMKAPWHYTKDMCYRTFKNLYGKAIPFVREGVAHNALDDAITQALHLQKIVAHVKGQPALLL